MTDLSSLIVRLEKATGPSRYDDCHVWVIAKGGDARMVVCDSSTKDFVWERGIDGMWIRGIVKFREIPKYTSSIDAAVALAERALTGATISDPAEVVREAIRGLSSEHRWHINLYKTGQLSGLARHIVLETLRALQSKGPEA